jgi:hypothetical protein
MMMMTMIVVMMKTMMNMMFDKPRFFFIVSNFHAKPQVVAQNWAEIHPIVPDAPIISSHCLPGMIPD